MSFKSTRPGVEPITVTPTKGPGGRDEEKLTHPAFGQIGIFRTSGKTHLYGSDFDHQYVITLRIHTSELHRHLSTDWHHGGKELVEVQMSEAQFATMLTSMNMGTGSPCTIRRIGDQFMPQLPDPRSRSEQFGEEFRESVQESVQTLDDLIADIDTLGISKKKADELKLRLRVARERVTGSATFVADRFEEHMEETVELAKVEVHGYAQHVLQRAGVAAIAAADPDKPFALEGPKNGE